MKTTSARKTERDAEKVALAELKRLPGQIRYCVINGGRTHKIVLSRWWTGTEPKTHFFRTASLAWEFCQGEKENKDKDKTVGLDYGQLTDAHRALACIKGTGKTLFEVADYYMRIGPGTRKVFTFSEAAKGFVESLVAQGRDVQYHKGLATDYRLAALPENEGGLGDVPLHRYKPETLAKWLTQGHQKADAPDTGKPDCDPSWKKGWSLHTTKNYYTAFAMLFNYAVRKEWLGENPMLHTELDSVRNLFKGLMGKIEIYTTEECKRLLETADMNESQLDLLGWYAVALLGGVRVVEMSDLQWSDFDFEAGEILVRPGVAAKGGEPRNVPMNCNMREWLDRVERRGGPFLDRTNLAKRVRALHAHAGVTHKQNAMRHTFSSYFYSQDPRPSQAAKLREILGHNTDEVLFKNYVQMVRKPVALRFWQTLHPEPMAEEEKARRELRRKENAELREAEKARERNAGWSFEPFNDSGSKPKKPRRPNLTLVAHPEVKAEAEWFGDRASPDLGKDE